MNIDQLERFLWFYQFIMVQLGLSWEVLGPYWESTLSQLGPTWPPHGGQFSIMGSLGVNLKPSLQHDTFFKCVILSPLPPEQQFLHVLATRTTIFACSGHHEGPSWEVLGPTWEVLGPTWSQVFSMTPSSNVSSHQYQNGHIVWSRCVAWEWSHVKNILL